MKQKSKIILSLLASVWIILPLYIIIHEAGHSLIAILCGARITKFSILGAYVSTEGGTYNNFTAPLMNNAGMLLPVLLAFVYALLYRKAVKNVFYRIISFFLCAAPVFSILPWAIIPILYRFGNPPPGDDVTNFLDNSGIDPLLVTIGAFMLLTPMILLVWHKGIVKNYWDTSKGFAVKETEREYEAKR